MERDAAIFRIHGGRQLSGEVEVDGAKNAALPIMAASILADRPVRLRRIPDVLDVTTLSAVLEEVGMRVRREGAELRIATVDPSRCRADRRLLQQMRAGFCVLGPLLARRGRALVALPGGCNIGDRPVDLHLSGLAAMGARLSLSDGYVSAWADRLRGATIDLCGPCGTTVTGTANLMMAAVLADGRTTLTGAAREPEIVDLARFLVLLGAKIDGAGQSVITIEGVERLGGDIAYPVIPDRIEAATLLIAAAATRGKITVKQADPEHLSAVLDLLQKAGLSIGIDRSTDAGRSAIRIDATAPIHAVDVVARPYPGLPTDLQAPLTALLSVSDGESTVRDEVFPTRFAHLPELTRMGADVRDLGGEVRIRGVERLSGATVTAPDLRAGAALVIAALAARGETFVRRVDRIDRGYFRLEEKLGRLGASICRETEKMQ